MAEFFIATAANFIGSFTAGLILLGIGHLIDSSRR